jgi:hypothetical protein
MRPSGYAFALVAAVGGIDERSGERKKASSFWLVAFIWANKSAESSRYTKNMQNARQWYLRYHLAMLGCV